MQHKEKEGDEGKGKPKGSYPTTSEVLEFLIKLLWFMFAVVVLWLFFEPVKKSLLPHLKSVEVFGVRAEFALAELKKVELPEGGGKWKFDKEIFNTIKSRIQRIQPLLQGAHILWIDDGHPVQNAHARRAMNGFGLFVDTVRSNEEALQLLKQTSYDIMISDMKRNGDEEAGTKFVRGLQTQYPELKVIFYIGKYDPSRGTPPYVFGITNRPDELLNLIMDILERSPRMLTHQDNASEPQDEKNTEPSSSESAAPSLK